MFVCVAVDYVDYGCCIMQVGVVINGVYIVVVCGCILHVVVLSSLLLTYVI